MNWKNLMILIFLIIIILIIIEVTKLTTERKCQTPTIEYRHIPQTFKDEQEQQVSIDDIFGIMFSKPSPWMITRGIRENGRQLDTSLGGRDFTFDNKKFGKEVEKSGEDVNK